MQEIEAEDEENETKAEEIGETSEIKSAIAGNPALGLLQERSLQR